MAGFRIGDAAFAGFRLIGSRPLVILAWGAVYGLVALVPVALILGLGWGGHLPAEDVAIRQARGWIAWTSIPANAVVYAAIFRATMTPQKRSLGYLRLGWAEARQGFLLVVRTLLLAVLAIVCAFATGFVLALIGVTMGANAPWAQVLAACAIIGAGGLVWLRLVMAAPMTFAEGRLRLFESWSFTRGRTWRLLGLAAVAAVATALAYAAALLTLIGLIALVATLARWRIEQAGAFFSQPMQVWMAAAWPYLLALIVAYGTVAVVVQTIFVAPWARAYRAMTAEPADAAPAPAPARALVAAFAPMPARARLGPAWIAPVFLILVMSFASSAEIVGVGIAALVQRALGAAAQVGWVTDVGLNVGYDLMVVVLLMMWAKAVERRPLASMGFRRPFGPWLLAWIGLGAGWALVLALALSASPPPAAGEATTQLAAPSLKVLLQFPAVFAVVILLAFSEEVMFRGWLLSALTARAGAPIAIAVSGLLFAALHVTPWELGKLPRIISFLSYAAIGVGFSVVALRQGQIWTTTALHSGYNGFLALIAMALNSETPHKLWKGVSDQTRGETDLGQAWIALGVNGAIALVLLGWWLYARRRPAVTAPVELAPAPAAA